MNTPLPLPWAYQPSCRACALHLATRGVPCLDHTADSMRDVRALAMGLVR